MSDAPLEKSDYVYHPVYRAIRNRFRMLYHIEIDDHIASVQKVYWRTEEGFDFVPRDARAWTQALQAAGFVHDLRDKHLGIIPSVGFFAALATAGEGYREPGSPSLHCAVADSMCKVHLDNVGFVLTGYGPDAGQHIIDELGWQTYVVAPLANISLPLASALARLHPVVPNSRQFRPFSEVGVQFDLFSARSRDQQTQLRLTIDVTHACSDATCGALSRVQGRTFRGENKVMLNFTVLGW